MPKQLNIALLQLQPKANDQDANRRIGEAACRRAAAMGADLALFPEMWSIGYTCGFDAERKDVHRHWAEQALGPDDPFIRAFRDLARELDMAIAITYLERWDGPPRNSVSIIDRHGEIILTFAKVHTCDFFPMEASCTPGDGFPVATLDTAAGPVEVGSMICYDREHPESARILMLNGAEIVLTPNACGLEERRLTQFRTRAWENAMGVAMTNYPAPHCNGHSTAYDAEANLLVEAGSGEGIFLATFDLDALREYRGRTFWGNAFRRPHRYGALTSLAIAPPFTPRLDGWKQPYQREKR